MEKLEDRQQELSQQAQILKQREGLQAPCRTCLHGFKWQLLTKATFAAVRTAGSVPPAPQGCVPWRAGLQQESLQEMELQARLAALQAEKAALPWQVAQLEARLAAEREQLQRQQASEQQGPAPGACEVQAATGAQGDQL